MTLRPLVQPLFDDAIDIVGDVHGHISALHSLLSHLDYTDNGLNHPEGRRLVFLGDLTDRGPDSPAVVRLIKQLVDAGRAQCVLGNHDFNLLRGEKNQENGWFYGQSPSNTSDAMIEATADEETRQLALTFFDSLPLALERHDLRVVHACWYDYMISLSRAATRVLPLYQEHLRKIEAELYGKAVYFADRDLALQNGNPVKLLTSGPEERAAEPFMAAGKLRWGKRVPWWEQYAVKQICVFGHYAKPWGEQHGRGRAICIDYGISYRGRSNRNPNMYLAAVRFPEKLLVFDDGHEEALNL